MRTRRRGNLHELSIAAGEGVAFCHSIVTVGGRDEEDQFSVRLTLGLRKIDGDWMVTHEHHSVPRGVGPDVPAPLLRRLQSGKCVPEIWN